MLSIFLHKINLLYIFRQPETKFNEQCEVKMLKNPVILNDIIDLGSILSGSLKKSVPILGTLFFTQSSHYH
ncbi:MAG: hypothetical protein IJV35_10830 [Neisseriaceae bacterium]|nr:hypothetical protein [Neisseriaceae bacterium]